jgi:MFS family permease
MPRWLTCLLLLLAPSLALAQAEVEQPAEQPSEQPPAAEPPGAAPPADAPPFQPELEASEGMHPLLLLPVQAGVGSAVGLLTTLLFPIAPFIVAFVVASTGDLLGQQRGPVLWPMVGGYLGMIVGGIGPPVGWATIFGVGALLASVGLLLGAGAMAMSPLVVLITGVGVALLYITGASAFVVPIAAALTGAGGNGFGAAIGYYFSAENKRPGDVEFRFPGFIAPSHGADRLIVRLPTTDDGRAAMAY